MDATEVMATLREKGMLLQSARGPIPNVAELVAGAPIKGSWWGHGAGHEIFATLNTLSSSPDVVRMRLVKGKVTLVHRRLWPALVRLADRFPPAALAALHEEHTASGAHRVTQIAFPEWVPAATRRAAAKLTEESALALLPPCLRQPRVEPVVMEEGSSATP
jgi:hypothetical protein